MARRSPHIAGQNAADRIPVPAIEEAPAAPEGTAGASRARGPIRASVRNSRAALGVPRKSPCGFRLGPCPGAEAEFPCGSPIPVGGSSPGASPRKRRHRAPKDSSPAGRFDPPEAGPEGPSPIRTAGGPEDRPPPANPVPVMPPLGGGKADPDLDPGAFAWTKHRAACESPQPPKKGIGKNPVYRFQITPQFLHPCSPQLSTSEG